MPAHRLVIEHPWILPAVEALAAVGLVPNALPAQEPVQEPAGPPSAHAVVECISVDAPIGMCTDVAAPFSFVPPEVPEIQDAAPAFLDLKALPTPALPPLRAAPIFAPERFFTEEFNFAAAVVEEPCHFPTDRASIASADLPSEAAGLIELPPNGAALLATNSESPAPSEVSGVGEDQDQDVEQNMTRSVPSNKEADRQATDEAEANLPKEADAEDTGAADSDDADANMPKEADAEADASSASSQQDAVLGGA